MNKKRKIKNITIVTIIDNCNFGTFLQAFALSSYMKSVNPSACVEIANYQRVVTKPFFVVKDLFNNKSVGFVNKLWGLYSQFCLYPSIRRRFFKELKKQSVFFSKKLCKVEELKELNSDIYVAGSDQIWNTFYNHGIDDVFYLAFEKNNCKKYAYAASFGNLEIEKDDTERLLTLFKDFEKITLREKVDSLPEPEIKNFLKNTTDIVLDPTLLFDKFFYLDQKFSIQHKFLLNNKEKYLLIYSVERNKVTKLLEIAKVLSKRLNLKIYYVESVFNARNIGLNVDKKISNASLGDFINLYNNASFVLASSFHGTVFSIIFKKQFFTLRPDKFDIRISSLLSQFDLNQRIIDSDSNTDFILNKVDRIDYSRIDVKLNTEILKSKAILTCMVNGQY